MTITAAEGKPARPFYSASEVAQHNTAGDCWVSLFGRVFDLGPLVDEHRGPLSAPLVEAAGTDISHWFDPATRQPRRAVHPETGVLLAVGRYVHVPPPYPSASFSTRIETCWWDDEERYCVGTLSRRTRALRVVNTLTGQEDELEVCSEERLGDIRRRYERFNRHADGYTWKFLGRPLSMSKTLDENGVPDDSDEFARLGVTGAGVPALHIYFDDDLTVA